jgi:superfamily II DNA/RNA helicase
MGDQIKALEKASTCFIATPGWLMDLFGRKWQDPAYRLNVVIDEADRMLDMASSRTSRRLPEARRAARLCSSRHHAAADPEARGQVLNDPRRVEVARPASANVIRAAAGRGQRGQKRRQKELCVADDFKNAIVFCNRKTTVRELAAACADTPAAGQIQGDMDQAADRRVRSLQGGDQYPRRF